MRTIFYATVAISSAVAMAASQTEVHAATVITTLQGLQQISANLSGAYVLGANIDASATKTWNGGAGFLPLGTATTPFTGSFNGAGFSITSLYISSSAADLGLFGYVGSSGIVENVGLNAAGIFANTSSYINVGALVGTNYGTVSSSYNTGTVTGRGSLDHSAGGLIGQNYGLVANSYATGEVEGGDTGGLVGDNFGTVQNSYATGVVADCSGGYRGCGGLVGSNYGTILDSYAAGSVGGNTARIGGLVGFNEYGSIANSYSTGAIYGTSGVYIGGLVGENNGPVSNSYAVGSVGGSGSFTAGGLIGQQDGGAVTSSYWDTVRTKQSTSAAGTGETTTALKAALPVGFISSIWRIIPRNSYPILPFGSTPY